MARIGATLRLHSALADSSWLGHHPLTRRLLFGGAAFLAADLVTGMAAFSLITLGALWYFCFSWIGLSQAYAAQGTAFGTAGQFQLAVFVVFLLPAAIVFVVYLAREAFRVPVMLWHGGRPSSRPDVASGRTNGRTPAVRQSSVARLDRDSPPRGQ